ncbi:MAG: hypothetical protein KDK70_42625, partial [Myxococcales bacterium]|nr:hypothetical protein [Myxococcales bacterium]
MHVCWILAGCLALVGCRDDEPTGADGTGTTGSTGEDSTADGTEGGPIVEQEVVPLELAALPVEAECFELDVPPDERSVSPEGHLWLRQDEQTWRVIDPFGSDDVQVLPPGVTALQAWGHDRAFVIDQDALWDVQGEWPQPLAWPEALAVPTGMCG